VKLVNEACTRLSFFLKHYDDSIRGASLKTRKGDAKRKNGKRENGESGIRKMTNL